MFHQAKARLRKEFTVSNVSTALNMVQEGLGLTILAEMSFSTLPPNVKVRDLNPQVWRGIALAVPSLKETSFAVQVFIQMVREVFH
ncbi:hypothetical protein GCM10020331_057750 [Ectobacillus funiculus]